MMVPVILIALVIMVLFCMTLPGFEEGIRFMFTPDFSVLLHTDQWVAAFGQAFFSLPVGEGILLTNGPNMVSDCVLYHRKVPEMITFARVTPGPFLIYSRYAG